jgi:putative spermidine/putrescine transport system permease protein
VADAGHPTAAVPLLRVRRSLLSRHPWLALTAPAFVLTLVLVVSLLTLIVYSFFSFSQRQIVTSFTLATWIGTLTDPFFWNVLGRTVTMAMVVTGVSLLIGYPIAYGVTKLRRPWLIAAIYVVFFTPLIVGIVVRSYGWIILLSDTGVVNGLLASAGLIKEPLHLSFNLTGVEIALVHGSMAMIVFPLINSIRAVDSAVRESAMDLGATRWQTFRLVTFPLSVPGIIAGCQIVFVLSVSAWVTPELLGGGHVTTMARLAYQDVTALNWPRGSIEVFALLISALALILVSNLIARFTYLGHMKVRS